MKPKTDIKTGKSLERLVSILERTLAVSSDTIRIETRKLLLDKITKTLREHDVVLTSTGGHHTTVLALECRDRSRPVSVGEVEGFHNKCQATGIDKGIIVSTKGFTKSARTKAEFHGIRCLDLESAADFDWFRSDSLEVQSIATDNLRFSMFGRPEDPKLGEPFEILDEKGTPVSSKGLAANVHQHLPMLAQGLGPGRHTRGIQFTAPGYKLRAVASGALRDVERIDVLFDIIIRSSHSPFKLVTYQEKSKKSVIAQGAVAHVALEGMSGDFVFTRKPGETPTAKFLIESIVHPPKIDSISVFTPGPHTPPGTVPPNQTGSPP